ncbi:MAG: PilZ domain-containing protein [Acidimicrobiia bacterium]
MALSLAGLAGAAYFSVRFASLASADHVLLATATAAFEAVAALGALAVAVVLRHRLVPLARRTVPRDVSVIVVRVSRECDPESLRVTLIALADLPPNRRAVVADVGGRAETEALAATYGAMYHVVDRRDRLALDVPIADDVRWVGVLDAGDVPAVEFIDVLTSIAASRFQFGVVQGAVRAVSERGVLEPCRLRDSLFVAGQLNPALGAAGAAMWRGSGAVFARAAWDDLCALPARHRRNETMASIVLRSRGWRVLAPAVPTLVATPGSPATAARVRQLRRACLDVLAAGATMRSSPLGRRGRLATRIGALAWITVHTGPARLATVLGVVAWSLVVGATPVPWSPAVAILGTVFWGALLAATAPGRNGSLRLGDGTRRALAGLFGMPLAAAVLGRRHRRGAPRVPAEIGGNLSGQPARVIDLTVQGAGIVVEHAVPVGTVATLMVSLPCPDGRRTGAVVKAVVRHTRPDGAHGGVRIGVSFADVPPSALEALTQFCRVNFPRRLLRAESVDATETGPSMLPEVDARSLDAGMFDLAGADR